MAWRCSGRTNTELVEALFKNGLVTSTRVRDAMMRVDRAHFVPASSTTEAYSDTPLPIGHAATISAPHMHASAVEALLPSMMAAVRRGRERKKGTRGARVLDVGSGSGYLTVVLAEVLAGNGQEDEGEEEGEEEEKEEGAASPAQAKVIGIEHIPELKTLGETNTRKSSRGRALLSGSGPIHVEFVIGDGRKGWSFARDEADGNVEGQDPHTHPGWDAIHVGAAASSLHDELVQQLARPGRMYPAR